MELKRLNSFCISCGNSLYAEASLSNIFAINQVMCNDCKSKLEKINLKMQINDIDYCFLYEYNSFLKELIYKYKGCYDIELKEAFLNDYKRIIKRKYKKYAITFPPSSLEDDKKRGYSHMEEIVKTLHMKYQVLFEKKFTYKQSDQHFVDRKEIYKVIKFKDDIKLISDKYLIIDDIFTSGSTIKAIINMLMEKGIKKENIKVIILCKVAN